MNKPIRSRIYVMGACLAIVSVAPFISPAMAGEETLDIQAFLPLFERNSLGRKVLEVSYSYKCTSYDAWTKGDRTGDIRLVFDAGTGKYREEAKCYNNPNDANSYDLFVDMWDGEESVSWERRVSTKQGYRALGAGLYENPGTAVIKSFHGVPGFALPYYDESRRPFSEIVPEQNPRLGGLSEDKVIIETDKNRFEFSKKTGALERLDFYFLDDNKKRRGRLSHSMYAFSNHVERSGFWLPLRVFLTGVQPDGTVVFKTEVSVDPKTLRLLDKVEPSRFRETLPVGCDVTDKNRKTSYTVTTADTLPTDVDALKKVLDKMLEQAQEQKAEAENGR